MFGKDLVVMVDFDESKALEELVLAFIPIWVRVSRLPFGMVNKVVGEAIGGEMGEFLEMDKGEDGSAVGRFLRIKIRFDIHEPLMRGVSVHVEEGELLPLWCPVMYEYLPDFCFTCGIIGHIDRVCEKKLEKREIQQFSKSLRFIPEKRRTEEGRGIKLFGGQVVVEVGAAGVQEVEVGCLVQVAMLLLGERQMGRGAKRC
jgi:hypothetical protein